MKIQIIILLVLPIIGFGQQSKGYNTRPLGVPTGNIKTPNPVLISDVPVYTWYRGCGPTALAMIFGYYDLHGFDDLFPGSSLIQNNDINLLIASEEHYADYALPLDYYPNLLEDISELGNPHQDNSIADFMNTSKSSSGNYWGWSWSNDISKAFEDYAYYRNSTYITETEYEYYSNNSWNNYKLEINNNRPVIILADTDGDNVTDHFVVGIGYNNSSQEFACLDTWDNNIHWYSWREMAPAVNWGIYGFNKLNIEKTIMNAENLETEKKGYKVIDFLGRKTKKLKQKPMLYIYDDKTTEKIIILE